MKKVYTVTFHLANNYGAMIQTYALQKVLQKKYDTKVLNYDNYAVSDGYRIIRKGPLNLLKKIYFFVRKLPHIFVEYKRVLNFKKFRSNIKMTKYFNNISHFDFSYIDCVVTGSDQIWNSRITGYLDDVYFLNFGNLKIKKVSYAASSGTLDIIDSDFIKKVQNIDFISVREESLRKKLSLEINKKITTVLDPSLLLGKKEWEKLKIKDRIIDKKYIFAYSVGNSTKEYYDAINDLSKETGLPIIFFDKRNSKGKIKCPNKSFYSSGPEEFLNILYNAEFVITTSFHALAMSLIFNKPFGIALSTYPDRIDTMLKKCDLEDRIINNNIIKLYKTKIDWIKVNNIIEENRKKSLEWLFNSLEGEVKDDKR